LKIVCCLITAFGNTLEWTVNHTDGKNGQNCEKKSEESDGRGFPDFPEYQMKQNPVGPSRNIPGKTDRCRNQEDELNDLIQRTVLDNSHDFVHNKKNTKNQTGWKKDSSPQINISFRSDA
jgi:hypothetical protein